MPIPNFKKAFFNGQTPTGPSGPDSSRPSLWGGSLTAGGGPKAAKAPREQEEGGIFPIWPFRWAILGTGLTLLIIAVVLKVTLYKDGLPNQPVCYEGGALSIKTNRIDYCALRIAGTTSQCGQPAADLWCKRNGQQYSNSFVPSTNNFTNTITLGNNAFGGTQSFDSICCDNQTYWPTAPKWLLWVSGVLLLYLVAVAVTKLLLLCVEVVLVGLVATEALYFFSGFEPILKHVSYFIGLVIWTKEVFWSIWCSNGGKACDDRWLHDAKILLNVAQCIMACQLGRLVALTLGKTFGLMYFFANQLPQVRRVLNQERYLAAMSTPHWARALIHAQEAAAAEAEAARARGEHALVVGGKEPLDGAPAPKFHGTSVLAYLKQDKQLLHTLPGPLSRWVHSLLAPGGWFSCCRGAGNCSGQRCSKCCPGGCLASLLPCCGSPADRFEGHSDDGHMEDTHGAHAAGHGHHRGGGGGGGLYSHWNAAAGNSTSSSAATNDVKDMHHHQQHHHPPSANTVTIMADSSDVAATGPPVPVPTTVALRTGTSSSSSTPNATPGLHASASMPRARTGRFGFPTIHEAKVADEDADGSAQDTPHTTPNTRLATASDPLQQQHPPLHQRALFRNATSIGTTRGTAASQGGSDDPLAMDVAPPWAEPDSSAERRAALLRLGAMQRRRGGAAQHHSDVAGLLEPGSRAAEASSASADFVTLQQVQEEGGGGGSDSPRHAHLDRRSLPVYGTQDEDKAAAEYQYLHERALEMQAEKQAMHAQQEQMKKMAADLNRELVAVDVGGVGALRKFTLFLRKYQTMTDDVLEKETRSLATRLFHNLKAYLEPNPQPHHGDQGWHNHYRFPSQGNLPALQGKVYGSAPSEVGCAMGDGGAAGPEASGGSFVMARAGGAKMPQVSSSPALVDMAPKEGDAASADGESSKGAPEPDAIQFNDFVAALRRARRTLSRTSTGSLTHTAKEAWSMFDKSHSSKLTEEDVRVTLFEVYKSRRNLALSIKANQAVCRSLQAAATFIIQTALVFVYMAIFGVAVAFSSGLDFFKTYVLAFSFIFGDSVKALFQSAIYLFAEHPFDVGDTLRIGDNAWMVEQFDLMFTVLVSGSGEWATMSNTALINSQLVNLSRSKAKGEVIKIKVPASMPLDVMADVKAAMKKVYEASPSEYVEGSIGCSIAEMETSQSLVLAAKWTYTFPPSEGGRMGKARGAMQEAVVRCLLEQGVAAIPLQLDFNILALKTKKD